MRPAPCLPAGRYRLPHSYRGNIKFKRAPQILIPLANEFARVYVSLNCFDNLPDCKPV